MKYKEWLSTWLALYVKPVVKIRTYQKYEQTVRIHILPSLGEKELDGLTAIALQQFVVDLTVKNGLSANTVNGIITVLQRSLKTAVLVGVIDKSYCDKIQRPKSIEKRVECFSLAEQKRIEDYVLTAKKKSYIGILLCLYTGLRIGEVLALEWTDIDFKTGILSVSKSCHFGKNENGVYARTVETPKTANSVRIIPLPKQLLAILKDAYKNKDSCYVVSYHGKPIATRSYQNTFDIIQHKLNLPHRGFHSLRHTFATRALECGMDVKTLSEILGHKNPTITLNRYVHSLIEHKTDMMNKLGKFCGLNKPSD